VCSVQVKSSSAATRSSQIQWRFKTQLCVWCPAWFIHAGTNKHHTSVTVSLITTSQNNHLFTQQLITHVAMQIEWAELRCHTDLANQLSKTNETV